MCFTGCSYYDRVFTESSVHSSSLHSGSRESTIRTVASGNGMLTGRPMLSRSIVEVKDSNRSSSQISSGLMMMMWVWLVSPVLNSIISRLTA